MHLQLKDWATEEELLRSAAYLREAAQIIEGEGWIQGASWLENKGYCSAGAITEVGRRRGIRSVDFLPTKHPSCIAESVFYRIHGEDITVFNDLPDRTKQQVIIKLIATAAIIEKEVKSWKQESSAS